MRLLRQWKVGKLRATLCHHLAVSADGELDAKLRAALAASRELGADYDRAMVDSIRSLVADHSRPAEPPAAPVQAAETRPRRLSITRQHDLTVASLVLAIPLSGIAGGVGHVPGLVVAWAGIVGVNPANRLAGRRGRDRF